MKTYLVCAACLILVGCSWREKSHREILIKLDAIKSELASKRAEPVRWAFANKREIDNVVFQWSHRKMEDIKKADGLSPEMEEKICQYEALQSELMRKRMDLMRARFPGRPDPPEASALDRRDTLNQGLLGAAAGQKGDRVTIHVVAGGTYYVRLQRRFWHEAMQLMSEEQAVKEIADCHWQNSHE